MSCSRELENLIWDAAESGTPTPALEDHLNTCPECRHTYEILTSAMAGFSELSQVQSPDPRVAIRARLERPRQWFPFAPAFARAAALSCLLILSGIFYFRTVPSSNPIVSKVPERYLLPEAPQITVLSKPHQTVKSLPKHLTQTRHRSIRIEQQIDGTISKKTLPLRTRPVVQPHQMAANDPVPEVKESAQETQAPQINLVMEYETQEVSTPRELSNTREQEPGQRMAARYRENPAGIVPKSPDNCQTVTVRVVPRIQIVLEPGSEQEPDGKVAL
jgi:hypothetical protein